MSSVATWPAQAEAWLDDRGKGAWIAAMVLGFILFWPLGLALLAYMIWSKRMFNGCSTAQHRRRHRHHARAHGFRSSGNSAFDSYKAETLRRLEEDQKAFEEFLERLREEGLRIPLVVLSAKGWLYEDFFRRLEALSVRDAVHFTGYVPGPDLPLLYNGAVALAMPSVYEGFGLPVLEAMACGTPVVSSNTSSLPEIGGQAALYFDPHDVEDMSATIRRTWTDLDLCAAMREEGLAQAGRFSWERAARETQAVYEEVLEVAG